MAEFAQPQVTREIMAEHARNLLDQQITTDNAITLAVGIFSRSELARAIMAANPKPIKYSSAMRRVERWFTGAAETRKPSKASREQVAEVLKGNQRALAQLFPQGVRMRLNATLVIGGDPSYSRRRTGIIVDFNAEETADLLVQAQEDPDEAWQTFFDVYICPAGWVEQPVIQFQTR